MGISTRATAIAFHLLLALACGAQAQQPASGISPHPSLIREDASQKISDHVFVIPDDSQQFVPNVGIVVGSRATLVVDTGMGVRNAETILREVAKVARGKELYLVTTHFHPEHDLGAHAFPAHTRMIRSREQQQDADEFGLQMAKSFSAISPLNAELLKDVTIRTADITFDKEHIIDLGGVRARILAMGPNHTRGDTAIFVEQDGVLFSGDVAMKAQPAFASPQSSLKQWLASLDRLATLEPKLIVPAHGPSGDIAFIAGYRSYLTAIQTRVARLKKAGKSLDETTQTVSAELESSYPDKRRMSGAIRTAYNEAQ